MVHSVVLSRGMTLPANFGTAVSVKMKNHPDWSESFVQKVIAEDPSILRLGKLILMDKERRQSGAGRLDLLLRDELDTTRFAVEIQLGSTDASHIIRTIEYWDIEKRQHPNVNHVAVIVAEEVESRFFNVISLFNRAIPIVAIKMSALEVAGINTLIFTKVLDHSSLPKERSVDLAPSVDRSYWERTAPAASMRAVDAIFRLISGFSPAVEPSYTKIYIGTLVENQVSNFAVLRPQKKSLKLTLLLDQSAETDSLLESAGLEFEYATGAWPQYRVRVTDNEISEHQVLLAKLLKLAYSNAEDIPFPETSAPEAEGTRNG